MILKFLNLLDSRDRLSITNFAIYVMVAKSLIFQVQVYDAIVFLSLIGSYCHRRYEQRLSQSKTQIETRVINIDTRMREISHDMDNFNLVAARMNKQSDEVQKIITGKTFERAFNPRGQML